MLFSWCMNCADHAFPPPVNLSLQWFYQEAERSEFIKLVINMTYVSASLSVSFADIFWCKLKKCWTIGSTIYLFTYWFMLLLDLVIGADLKAPWFMVLYVIIIGTHFICPFVVYIVYIFLPTRCHLYFRLLRSRLFCLCNVKVICLLLCYTLLSEGWIWSRSSSNKVVRCLIYAGV